MHVHTEEHARSATGPGKQCDFSDISPLTHARKRAGESQTRGEEPLGTTNDGDHDEGQEMGHATSVVLVPSDAVVMPWRPAAAMTALKRPSTAREPSSPAEERTMAVPHPRLPTTPRVGVPGDEGGGRGNVGLA